jgi:hypothetical protein
MMPAADVLNSLNSDARQTLTSVFEALEGWRDEVSSVNERHLAKVLDQVAASQRAMGWPDRFTTAAREHLTMASKTQTYMIDQVMDAWEHQLKSAIAPSILPGKFKLPAPPQSGAALMGPMQEMMRLQELTLAPFQEFTLAPFRFWMQAAEMWQRSLSGALPGPDEPAQQGRPTRKPAN